MSQPEAPLYLDLDKPMEAPMLLAAGAVGGLGNPHFATKSIPKPKFALKGETGMKLAVQLELKLLADVGLVGLPNAGKSTLLRSLSNSRARVGSWAFTTLQPNIGTVILDNHKGRPSLLPSVVQKRLSRPSFTIADIPGLIQDAHLDRGLGLGFLRHIERAAILAFVIDLSAGPGVEALKGLWNEVSAYEALRDRELNAETERRIDEQSKSVKFRPMTRIAERGSGEHGEGEEDDEMDSAVLMDHLAKAKLPEISMPPISSKPWLVVATKADVRGTEDNFAELKRYLVEVENGDVEHPSGKKNAWRKGLRVLPVSAIRGEGTERVLESMVELLGE